MGHCMKKFIKKHFIDIVIIILFSLFIVLSRMINFNFGETVSKNFITFFKEMISFLPPLFILIGLFDVWVPKENIQKHIGNESGIKGILLVILLAMLQAGPLYGAFPVAYILWKKGSSFKNIFIYLGAFSTLKIPMLSFEISFLGLKFTLLRTLITLPFFILIGFIMENYLKNKNYEIKDYQSK